MNHLEVKEVAETQNWNKVNDLLESGWVLLAVASENVTRSGEGSNESPRFLYSLGKLKED